MPLNNWFIACNNFNTPTAKELANRLGIGFGKSPKRSRTRIIRWGFSKDLFRRQPRTLYFPHHNAIQVCSNKLESLAALDAADVSVPVWYTQENDLRDARYPLYSRKLYHTMGKDIIMVHNIDEARRQFRNNRYLVESIPYKKEYRIHVFGNEIISCSKKYFREDLWERLGRPEMRDIIRNNERGWGYYDIQDFNNIPQEVRNQALNAVRALGLIWGAVDLIRTPNNDVYVLEVNSAPGLRNRRVDIYVNKFRQLIENPNQFIQQR